MLAFRLIFSCPFPTVLEITERLLDVGGLSALVATGKEQDTSLSQHRVMHAIAKNLAVAKISGSNTVNPNRNLGLGAGRL
jgi:hypothetical protein